MEARISLKCSKLKTFNHGIINDESFSSIRKLFVSPVLTFKKKDKSQHLVF